MTCGMSPPWCDECGAGPSLESALELKIHARSLVRFSRRLRLSAAGGIGYHALCVRSRGAVVLGSVVRGLITALTVLITSLWSGAPISVTSEELNGVIIASYDPSDTAGDNTGPG